MLYLSEFSFPSAETEEDFLMSIRETCYTSFYPFGILTRHSLETIRFGGITLLYGGNGCGKTTVLNIISEALGLERSTLYNRSSFFEKYIERCDYKLEKRIPKGSKIITSDDVFDYMLDLRSLNESIDYKREDIFEEWVENKFDTEFRFNSMEDFEKLRAINKARSLSRSQYTRRRLMNNVQEHSNGESAFIYFSDKIRENALYLLDEPENSLSPEKQLELCSFLEDSARFFGCQFIISTHSPFLLSMNNAFVYDLDAETACRRRWTELPNVRAYYDFFKKHSKEFERE